MATTTLDRLTKKLQREETRRKILRSAAQVFAAKGFHSAVVDDIVKASGTSKGAVYFYFESKEQIFLSLVEDFATSLAREIQAAVQRARGLVAQVEAAVATLVRIFQADRDLAKIVLVDWPSVGAEFQGRRIALKAMLVEVLRGISTARWRTGRLPRRTPRRRHTCGSARSAKWSSGGSTPESRIRSKRCSRPSPSSCC